jgi:RNA polymerase sigma factor (sigma-70 family)
MESDTERRAWVLAALDQFEGRLLRYTQRLLNDAEESRDVVQFVFLRLCDQSPEKIGDRLAQWLYTVCRNRAMDVLRVNGRTVGWGDVGWDKAASAAAGPPSSNGKPVGRRSRGELVPPYTNKDPADSAEQAELHALLRALIEHLPAGQREAIDLWADGFSYQQIADITSQKEGHVRVLVHRGLKALREDPQVRAVTEEEGDRGRRSEVRGQKSDEIPTRSVSEGPLLARSASEG